MTEPNAALKIYRGNCHCGAFKFTVKLPELTTVFECDCSICQRKAYMWAFPGEGDFNVEKGEGSLKEYRFNSGSMIHKFCPVCATSILGKQSAKPEGQGIGINIRTLEGVEFGSLKSQKYEGATIEPQHVPAKWAGPEPKAKFENAKIYTGSCHCGNATIAFKSRGPLPEGNERIGECDCSMCARKGTILVYPNADQIQVMNTSPLISYSFGKKFRSYNFCPTCGVIVYVKRLPISPEEFRKWEGNKNQKEWESKMPVNLRCFVGVEWADIKVEKMSWKDAEPKYEV